MLDPLEISKIIQTMADNGCTAEQMAAVYRIVFDRHQEAEQERKRKQVLRTRRYREQRAGGEIPYSLRLSIYERDGYACVYCGATEKLSCDHVEPVYKGGPTTYDNLATACTPCNSKKRDRDRKYVQRHSTDIPRTSTDIHGTVLPPCPPSPPDKEKVSIPLKEINLLSPLNPPSPLSGVVRDGNFTAFWELFPNKVGKRQAEEKFKLALKRASLDQIMAGLAEYAAKTDDRPWCNPATWLNQDRWEDQQPPPVKPSAKPLTFAQANYLRNQELIHAALGPKPGPAHQTEPVRRILGAPTLRLVPVVDSDAVEF